MPLALQEILSASALLSIIRLYRVELTRGDLRRRVRLNQVLQLPDRRSSQRRHEIAETVFEFGRYADAVST